jgi:hypothetical protein
MTAFCTIGKYIIIEKLKDYILSTENTCPMTIGITKRIKTMEGNMTTKVTFISMFNNISIRKKKQNYPRRNKNGCKEL